MVYILHVGGTVEDNNESEQINCTKVSCNPSLGIDNEINVLAKTKGSENR